MNPKLWLFLGELVSVPAVYVVNQVEDDFLMGFRPKYQLISILSSLSLSFSIAVRNALWLVVFISDGRACSQQKEKNIRRVNGIVAGGTGCQRPSNKESRRQLNRKTMEREVMGICTKIRILNLISGQILDIYPGRTQYLTVNRIYKGQITSPSLDSGALESNFWSVIFSSCP